MSMYSAGLVYRIMRGSVNPRYFSVKLMRDIIFFPMCRAMNMSKTNILSTYMYVLKTSIQTEICFVNIGHNLQFNRTLGLTITNYISHRY